MVLPRQAVAFQGFPGRHPRGIVGDRGWHVGIGQARVGHRDPPVGLGVIRILGQRVPEVIERAPQGRLGAPENQGPALEVEVVGLRVAGPPRARRGQFGPNQRQGELAHDRLGDRVLYGKGILDGPVVAFGPEFDALASVDELDAHPHLFASPPHRSLEHDRDAQFVAHLANVEILPALERKG